MKVTILGAGAYALALSSMAYENNNEITIWTAFAEEKEALIKYGYSERLPDYKVPTSFVINTELKQAVSEAELIVIAVPTGAVDEVCRLLEPYYEEQQSFCLASKGIEQGTCRFVSDVFLQHLHSSNYAVISGGSFAVDIIKKVPIGLSIAGNNQETIKLIKQALQNKYLKLRETDDVLGVEICGSIKNIIAIASGILDGMGLPESSQAMFITEALHDIKELIHALGGSRNTILSFAGFGDILLTCTSKKSRNFSFGRLLGQNTPSADIESYKSKTTIEGLYTLESVYKLLNDKTVDMPIIDLIYDIVFNGKNPKELISFLNTK